MNREVGGRMVRLAWVSWAERQANPKPSWLVPWEDLGQDDREADRYIWDVLCGAYTIPEGMEGMDYAFTVSCQRCYAREWLFNFHGPRMSVKEALTRLKRMGWRCEDDGWFVCSFCCLRERTEQRLQTLSEEDRAILTEPLVDSPPAVRKRPENTLRGCEGTFVVSINKKPFPVRCQVISNKRKSVRIEYRHPHTHALTRRMLRTRADRARLTLDEKKDGGIGRAMTVAAWAEGLHVRDATIEEGEASC